MNVPNTPLANSVAPFQQVGGQSVGQESSEAKQQALPPIEELKNSAGALNRRDPDDKAAQSDEQQRVRDGSPRNLDESDADGRNSQEQEAAAQQKEVELRERQEIAALSARDREVRAHEQAHAAVGGRFAGAPTYSFRRGPNGVNYAVGGEVSISAGSTSGDPQATLRQAQQIKRAALAPANPSAQDRRVAASASQQIQQARIAITAQAAQTRTAGEARSDANVERNVSGSGDSQVEPGASFATNVDAQASVGLATPVDAQQSVGLASPSTDPQVLTGLASPVNIGLQLINMGLASPTGLGTFVDKVV